MDFNHLSQRSESNWYQYLVIVDSHPQFCPQPKIFEWYIELTKPKELQIKGRCFAEVRSVMGNSAWPMEPAYLHAKRHLLGEREVTELVQWYWRCKSFAQRYAVDPKLHDSFDGLLLCRRDRMAGETTLGPTRQRTAFYDAAPCKRLVEAVLNREDRATELDDIMKLWYSLQIEEDADTGRLLCHLIGDGFEDIAWVPKTAQVGDTFCIFAGEPYPFLLRERDKGRFTMLGDTFLATVSLLQALGMTGEVSKQDFGKERDPAMDWQRTDPDMQTLLDGLGWITLR